MKHINEQTLELLVLGDIKTKKRERQIRKHLAECVGCDDLYAEIRDYYENVRLEGNDVSVPVHSMAQRSLARRQTELEPYFALPETEVVSYTEVKVPSVWRRVRKFGREHPAASSLFAVAVVALSLYSWDLFRLHKEVPAYYYCNTKENRLEIFGKSNAMLWSLPSFNMNQENGYELRCNAHETVIADLNGDGQKEVVTTVPLRGDYNARPLRMYNSKGELLKTFAFDDGQVNFSGEHYFAPFLPTFLIPERMPSGATDLFVYATNGRSPSFLARLDPRMNVVGKYWHYGNFTPYPFGPVHNGVHDIVITGIDDMDEMSASGFNFVAVLDPTKIVGEKESGETRGFGLAPSDAELYYIKLPKSSLQTLEGPGPTPRMLSESTDSVIQVQVEFASDNSAPGYWGFDFVFSTNNMAVTEVKYTEPTPKTFDMLRRKGKLHGTFDKQYLENLKNGVRYWNGSAWVKTPTRIEHSEMAAK